MAAVGERIATVVASMILYAIAFILPIILPVVAIASGASPAEIGVAMLPLGILLVARLTLVGTQHEPMATIPWHPVTAMVALAGQAVAAIDHLRPDRRS
jgi:hypothetical protein